MISLDNILFYFAGMPVYVCGFLTGLGLLLGTMSALTEGRRRDIGWFKMFDFILGTAVTFFLAGRISILVQDYGAGALLKPWKIITEISHGLDTRVGLWCSLAYGLFSLLRNRMFNLRFFDAITPGVLLIRSLYALGSSIFGKATTVPWAVRLGDFRLHPLSLYAAVGYYLIYVVVRQMSRNERFDGQLLIGAETMVVWLKWLLLFATEDASKSLFWLYPIGGILLAALWSFGYYNSPQLSHKHRRGIGLFVSIVTAILVVLVMVVFFYSRFA